MTNERLKELLYKLIDLENCNLNNTGYFYLEDRLKYFKVQIGITDEEIKELDIVNKCKHFPESTEENRKNALVRLGEFMKECDISLEELLGPLISNTHKNN